jgi:hypothetical protein
MEDELRSLLAPYLGRQEQVRWSGRPRPWRFARGTLATAVFAVPWTGFVLSFELMVIGGKEPLDGKLFLGSIGALFLAVGLAMLTYPLRELAKARRLRYAVTDHRAWIVRLGPEPEVRDYTPADMHEFAALSRPLNGPDMLFSVDRNVAHLVPNDVLSGKGGPFSRVGFVGLEAPAQVGPLLDALRRQAPSHGTRRSDDREAHLEAKGSYTAFRTKLAALVSERERLGTLKAGRLRAGAWITIAVFALIGLCLIAFPLRVGAWPAVLAVLALFGTVIGLIAWGARKEASQAADRLACWRALANLVAGLAEDAHPRSPLQGFVDFGEAQRVRPFRAIASQSRALKTYHRHHWARLSWGLADGNMLCLNLIDRVKLKSGVELKRSHHVRGRLSVNPARYDAAGLESFQAGELEVRPVRVGDRVWLCFRGNLQDLQGLGAGLEALYARLHQVKRPFGTRSKDLEAG